jgi:hypothetical protein
VLRTAFPRRHGCGWIPHDAVENRFLLREAAHPRMLPLGPIDLLAPEEVDADVGLVAVQNTDVADRDQAAIALPATLAAPSVATGHEIEFSIRQFDGVSEIGDLLHVGLPSVFELSVETVALTAATLSLAARRKSGCTTDKIFLRQAKRSFHSLVTPDGVIADLRVANLQRSQRNRSTTSLEKFDTSRKRIGARVEYAD